MNPSQVIDALNVIGRKSETGLAMTRQTLLRYEWQGLIPKPERGSKGQGQGRWTEYPAEAVWQAFAAWSLIHGRYENITGGLFFEKPPKIAPATVAVIRKAYFERQNFFATLAERTAEYAEARKKSGVWFGLSRVKEIVEELSGLPEAARAEKMVLLDWLFLDIAEAGMKKKEIESLLQRDGVDVAAAQSEFGAAGASMIEGAVFEGLLKAYVDIYELLLAIGCEYAKDTG